MECSGCSGSHHHHTTSQSAPYQSYWQSHHQLVHHGNPEAHWTAPDAWGATVIAFSATCVLIFVFYLSCSKRSGGWPTRLSRSLVNEYSLPSWKAQKQPGLLQGTDTASLGVASGPVRHWSRSSACLVGFTPNSLAGHDRGSDDNLVGNAFSPADSHASAKSGRILNDVQVVTPKKLLPHPQLPRIRTQ